MSSGKQPIRTAPVWVRIVPAAPVAAPAGSLPWRTARGVACEEVSDADPWSVADSVTTAKGTVWFSLAMAPDDRNDEARHAAAGAATPGRRREDVMMSRVLERP